jgi:hypothetical protein
MQLKVSQSISLQIFDIVSNLNTISLNKNKEREKESDNVQKRAVGKVKSTK